ncbi:maleylacetoacetate isomerase [Salinarimonas ramus]|uniref:Maleylacetoacetate isomerase n=1 Tax=Salinarimonas ramus TaxID=690164 RepID=A0A917V5J5_9HYPH|nr:maleylacetoacetate isomerase [Salinarimonas ramus]GGK42942.1 maleylacetoacetate isomerase [Salinarimonas ramus]
MKLYGYFRSSAAYRVRIALNLKGIAYEPVIVNLLKGDNKTDAYRALHPQAKVPTLETDEGDVLIQSPAILEWIEERYPEPSLLPGDAVARARIRAACAIVACDIHPLNNLPAMGWLRERLGADDAAVNAWYAHWITQGFAALERMIAPAPFAFGPQPTLADLHIVPQVFNARRFSVPLEAFPKIRAVDEACAAHPAFAAAAPQNQPDAT